MKPASIHGVKKASSGPRKVDVRLPGKVNSNSHGARPVHLIIMMIKWIRTSRLSIKNSLSEALTVPRGRERTGYEPLGREQVTSP